MENWHFLEVLYSLTNLTLQRWKAISCILLLKLLEWFWLQFNWELPAKQFLVTVTQNWLFYPNKIDHFHTVFISYHGINIMILYNTCIGWCMQFYGSMCVSSFCPYEVDWPRVTPEGLLLLSVFHYSHSRMPPQYICTTNWTTSSSYAFPALLPLLLSLGLLFDVPFHSPPFFYLSPCTATFLFSLFPSPCLLSWTLLLNSPPCLFYLSSPQPSPRIRPMVWLSKLAPSRWW